MITKITKHILKEKQFEIYYNEALDIYSNGEIMIKSKFCTLSKYFDKNRVIKTNTKNIETYFNSDDISNLNGNVSFSYFVRINKIPMQVIEFEDDDKTYEIYISKNYYRYLVEFRPYFYINPNDISEPVRLVIDDEIIGLIMPINIENLDKYHN